MSRSVRRLLSLMRFFEAEKRTSISLFLARWSPSPDTTVTNVLDVAQNSDPIQFLWTFLHSLGDDLAKRKARREAHGCVDIRSAHSDYLIGTDARRVSSHNHIRLGVKVFRANAATLLIRCLSRKTPTSVRQFSVRLQDFGKSDMQDRFQVIYAARLRTLETGLGALVPTRSVVSSTPPTSSNHSSRRDAALRAGFLEILAIFTFPSLYLDQAGTRHGRRKISPPPGPTNGNSGRSNSFRTPIDKNLSNLNQSDQCMAELNPIIFEQYSSAVTSVDLRSRLTLGLSPTLLVHAQGHYFPDKKDHCMGVPHTRRSVRNYLSKRSAVHLDR
ncbi:hypothetical protein PAXINDRAFT_99286 [Paxillus involutus ATCC 200175]|uniref:Unplaced genomic scaffold PAXINscaffold_13, whole genome shotgun sequence n=1 Tax=Paxillus involutus ATCC 200175 TaxID=664439 RepID=A0A0C9U9C4_PAXIN|nr:hypothetical protein PAXINDRAFT_99286 [Paxillus involutus ATCC 200175]